MHAARNGHAGIVHNVVHYAARITGHAGIVHNVDIPSGHDP